MIQKLNQFSKSSKFQIGEIWLADLNPGQGTEPGKIRPVLILQHQALLNIDHPSTIIIPLTTNLIDEAYPLRIRIFTQDKLRKDSDLLIDQIRSIDNRRLATGPLTKLSEQQMKNIYKAVNQLIGYFQPEQILF